MDFQIGDVVMLKSGGPAMTVNHADSVVIACVFFTEGKLEERSFDAATLKRVSRDLPNLGPLIKSTDRLDWDLVDADADPKKSD